MADVLLSYKEVDRSTGDVSLFLYFLVDATGSEHLAATGTFATVPVDEDDLLQEDTSAMPALVMTYRGSFTSVPGCDAVETTSKEELLQWLQGVIATSQAAKQQQLQVKLQHQYEEQQQRQAQQPLEQRQQHKERSEHLGQEQQQVAQAPQPPPPALEDMQVDAAAGEDVSPKAPTAAVPLNGRHEGDSTEPQPPPASPTAAVLAHEAELEAQAADAPVQPQPQPAVAILGGPVHEASQPARERAATSGEAVATSEGTAVQADSPTTAHCLDSPQQAGATDQQQPAAKPASSHAPHATEAPTAAAPAGAAAAAAIVPAKPAPVPQPLHFVSYRVEQYNKGAAEGPLVRRWWMMDSNGREHIAVDTTHWNLAKQEYVYEAVPPFSQVRPHRCSNQKQVQGYLDQYIPPLQRQQMQQQAAAASGADAGKPAKRKRGRPRKLSEQQGAETSGTGADSKDRRGKALTTAATEGGAGAVPRQAGQQVAAVVGAGQGQAVRQLAFIADAARRKQLLDARREAVLQHLAGLKAECGVDYTLTLVTAEHGMEVHTSSSRVAVAREAAALAAPVAVSTQQAPALPAPESIPPTGVPAIGPGATAPAAAAAAAMRGADRPAAGIHPAGAPPGVPALPAGLPRFPQPGSIPPGAFLPLLAAQQQQALGLAHPAGVPPGHPAASAAAMAQLALRGGVPLAPPHEPLGQPVLPQQAGARLNAVEQAKPAEQAAQWPEQAQPAPSTITPGSMQAAGSESRGLPKRRQGRAGKEESSKRSRLASGEVTKRGSDSGLAHLSDVAEAELDRGLTQDGEGVKQLAKELQHNTEPYMQGAWRREPYAPHPLTQISAFEPAPDCGEAADAPTLLAKLRSSLTAAVAASPAAAEAASGQDEELVMLAELPAGLPAADVDVRAVWGLDKFTRRNVFEALAHCSPSLGEKFPSRESSDRSRNDFIDRYLLPALNRLGDKGWDLSQALRLLRASPPASSSPAPPAQVAATAEALGKLVEGAELHFAGGKARRVAPEDREYFRVHPKGEGVVLTASEGLAEGAFVGEYLGELYTPWTWLEREEKRGGLKGAGKRGARMRMGASADFYNVVLERPATDPQGYDVLFVNAVGKGNFTSRLSHSCSPNCKTVTVVAGGRITIGIWTLRPVAPGEELTLDYGCETDNEREFTASTCLCGAADCRGSFLYYVDKDSPLKQFLTSHHGFLERCRLLVLAGSQPQLSNAEQERLQRHGLREFALTDGIPGKGTPLPSWLCKWASLALEFIEAEAAAMPRLLTDASNAGNRGQSYTGEEAAEEVQSLAGGRLQSLAIALDKAKLCLRHQALEARGPPLRPLSDQEVVEYLWKGKDSIARRAVGALVAFTRAEYSGGGKGISKSKAGSNSGSKPPRRLLPGGGGGGRDTPSPSGLGRAGSLRRGDSAAEELEMAMDTAVEPAQEELANGTALASEAKPPRVTDALADQDLAGATAATPGAAAAAAAAAGGADGLGRDATEPAAGLEAQEGVLSTVLELAELLERSLESKEVETVQDAQAGLRMLAGVLRSAGPNHAALHDVLLLYASTRNFVAQADYEAFTVTLANGAEGGRYPRRYLWGVLDQWWRSSESGGQAEKGPSVVDRRGCLLLPEPECCYAQPFASGKYARPRGERRALLEHMRTAPLAPWPASTFAFRSAGLRVHGSPQLDAVLEGGAAGTAKLAAMIEELAGTKF